MATPHRDLAIFRHFPALRAPWVSLGEFPTPLQELGALPGSSAPLFVKREDLSSPHYGGNKVRTLEAHLGRALAFGAKEVWATGAYGSNHAIATVTHALRVGLEAGVMLWPQPPTRAAHANMSAILANHPYIEPLASVATLPLGMTRLPGRVRAPIYLMSPGGATPDGALAHVAAGLELAEQISDGKLPEPLAIVLAVGSTCTSAGLLAGVHVAAELGIAFRRRVPIIHAVRVTPWPVTSRTRIAFYARETIRRIEHQLRRDFGISTRRLYDGLHVDRRYLGRGYGRPTRAGRAAIETMKSAGGPILDVVYSAKSGAAFVDLATKARGPIIFWATKSAAPLMVASDKDVRLAPKAWRQWLEKPPL